MQKYALDHTENAEGSPIKFHIFRVSLRRRNYKGMQVAVMLVYVLR